MGSFPWFPPLVPGSDPSGKRGKIHGELAAHTQPPGELWPAELHLPCQILAPGELE